MRVPTKENADLRGDFSSNKEPKRAKAREEEETRNGGNIDRKDAFSLGGTRPKPHKSATLLSK